VAKNTSIYGGLMAEKSTFIQLRENEREKRKTLIIAAAMNLFKEKSFHEIGMRDIASEAGVSPASIYRYFPSRDDLFVEALIRDINKIEKRLRVRIEEKSSIDSLAVDVVDYLIDNEATFQMMCHFLMRGEENKKAFKKFNAVMIYFTKMFDEVVTKTEGAQGLRFHSQAFFASLAGIVMTFRHYPGRSPQERREYMHKLALMIMREGIKISAFESSRKK
jgi:AcrR family transcriptional regulator